MTFDNLFNFRDLGGPRTDDGGQVQPRRLYRSESVAYLSEADAARLVDEFGLATVVDLRGEREVARWGRGLLGERPVRYVHVPITDVTRGLGNMSTYYIDMLTRRADDMVGLLRRLLEPGALPAVVHCEAGCDRTGVVAATVLGLVGVPNEAIITDFDLTQPALPAMNQRWKASYLARGHPLGQWVARRGPSARKPWRRRSPRSASAGAAGSAGRRRTGSPPTSGGNCESFWSTSRVRPPGQPIDVQAVIRILALWMREATDSGSTSVPRTPWRCWLGRAGTCGPSSSTGRRRCRRPCTPNPVALC